MKIDLENYDIRKDYIVVYPIRQHDELGPERGKYELHSIGTIAAVPHSTSQETFNPGDTVIYDGSKSITIIESTIDMEFVPKDNILAVKEER